MVAWDCTNGSNPQNRRKARDFAVLRGYIPGVARGGTSIWALLGVLTSLIYRITVHGISRMADTAGNEW